MQHLIPSLLRAGFTCRLVSFLAALFLGTGAAFAQSAAADGHISGTVVNDETKAALPNASVKIVELNRTVHTDAEGEFDFSGVAPGSYTITAGYTGLEDTQQSITAVAGQRSTVTFLMRSAIIHLEALQVYTDAAGQAKVVTEMHESPNLVYAAAADGFGNYTAQNPGEILMRLPGVSATLADGGEVSNVAVRGVASNLNTVTSDGTLLAPVASNATRMVRFATSAVGQYDTFEVIDALTPDMDASSLGGTINMKTKSPLLSEQDNSLDYRLGVKWTPPFAPEGSTAHQRPFHPDTSALYTGVFDFLGRKRSLGVQLSGTYYEYIANYYRTTRDWQSTNAPDAYIWDLRGTDYFQNRHLTGISTRVDWQATDNTLISIRGIDNYSPTHGTFVDNEDRAFTSQTLATVDANGNPTGTGTILPGFTRNYTAVRQLAASEFELDPNANGQVQIQETAQMVIQQKLNNNSELDFDFNAALGRLDQISGQSFDDKTGGTLTTFVPNIGYTVDARQSLEYPKFIQTAGPSVYNIANYTNTSLTRNGTRRDAHVYTAKADYKLNLDHLVFPSVIRAGLDYRRQDSIASDRGQDLHTFAGSLAPYVDNYAQIAPKVVDALGFEGVPIINVGALDQNLKDQPQNWVDNAYYDQQQTRVQANWVKEGIDAAYLEDQTKFGSLTVLGGARIEQTDIRSFGWIAPVSMPTITDPVARVNAEYSPDHLNGFYTNVLPSLHLSYAFTPQLLARLSYSTGVGRPEFTNYTPTQTVNTTAQTVTIQNPDIKAQTSQNLDFDLQYYTKSSGMMSVGLFQKDINNFIFTGGGGVIGTGANNGYQGQYAGYTTTEDFNGGTAKIKGYELVFQQRVNVGPSWLRRAAVFANYTYLTSSGNYGLATAPAAAPLAQFVPQNWNVGASYSVGPVSMNIRTVYTGAYLFTYSATPARLLYKNAYKNTSTSFSYELNKKLSFYVDIYDVFNEAQSYHYAIPEHLYQYTVNGMIVNFGIRGHF